MTTHLGGYTAFKEAAHSSLQVPSALHKSGDGPENHFHLE